jgi:hypothetical protein
MAEVPIDSIIDVTVSLGTQPTTTASFTSAAFLADLTDVAFSDAYRIYESLTEVAVDFADTTKTYKFAALAFGGNFKTDKLYVIKYRTTGTVLTPVAALTATLLVDNTPYWIGADDHADATVTALAAFCEAEAKMYVNSTQQADVLVPATATDIGSVLQDAAYNHAFTLYNAAADTAMAEGGIVGAMAAIPAGTSTAEYKTLVGVTVDALNATQRSACELKNVAYYMPTSGVNCLFNTKVASGQFLDTIVFSDWLKARIQEQLFSLLKRESDLGRKVSYDEAGFAKVRQAIETVVQVGLNNGSISPDVEPIVRTPLREEILDADRANRILPDVVVEVLYSSAVHTVLVRAYVTI